MKRIYKKTYKRWIAIMLMLCMIFTMTPGVSLAEQVDTLASITTGEGSGVPSSEAEPAETEPEETEPTETEPAETESAETETTEAESTEAEPAETESTETESAENKPETDESEENETEEAEPEQGESAPGDAEQGDKATPSDAEKNENKKVLSWEFIDPEGMLLDNTFTIPEGDPENPVDFDLLVSLLPKAVNAELEDKEEQTEIRIEQWSCEEYVQDAEGNWPMNGKYVFSAELEKGYTCEPAPVVNVVVGAVMMMAATNYPISINGKQVTSLNTKNEDGKLGTGGIAYTPAKSGNPAKLELTNAIIENGGATATMGVSGINAIAANEDLEIVISGTNKVYNNFSRDDMETFGIQVNGKLTITAPESDATLNISTTDAQISTTKQKGVRGIKATNITVSGGTLTTNTGKGYGCIGILGDVTATNEAKITVISGENLRESYSTIGISGKLTVQNKAVVEATGGKSAGYSEGIDGGLVIKDGCKVTATSGTAVMSSFGASLGSVGSTIDDGTLIVKGGAGKISAGINFAAPTPLAITGNGAKIMASGAQGIRNSAQTTITFSPDTLKSEYTFKKGDTEGNLTSVDPATDTKWYESKFIEIVPKTPKPTFAGENATQKMADKTATTISFPVSNWKNDYTYKIYDAETGGNQLTSNPGIANDGISGFTLTFTTPPTAQQTYYVSASEDGDESARTMITVKSAMESGSLVTAFETNVADMSIVKGDITATEGTQGTIELSKLQYAFQDHIANLPVKFQVSKGATVTASPEGALKQETNGSEVYWTGTYDFSDGKKVTFTVTSEDKSSIHTYVASASILRYKMYIWQTNSKLTSGTNGSSIALMQPINTVFTANPGYTFNEKSIEVKINNIPLDSQKYTWILSDENKTATLNIEGTLVTGLVDITVKASSTAKQITGFTIPKGETTIDENAHTVKVVMPYGTNLSALTPTITLSIGATVSPASGASQDFTLSETTPIEYTVTADDGSKQVYDVTAEITAYPVTYTLSKIKADLSYPAVVGKKQTDWKVTLDAADNCIVPAADKTSTSNLQVTMDGNILNTPKDYTYTPSNDGASATIAITKAVTGPISIKFVGISTDNRITSFTVAGQSGNTDIDQDKGTIKVKMPVGTDLTTIAPKIEIEADAKVTPGDGSVQNFADYPSIAYTVTAENGDTKTYRVTVEIPYYVVEYPYAKHITKISGPTLIEQNKEVKAVLEVDDNYSQTTVVTRGEKTLTSGTEYTYSYDSKTRQATITIPKEQVTGDITFTTTAAHSLAELKDFQITGQAYAPKVTKTSISTDAKPDYNIDVEMLGTSASLDSLSPTFTLSENAICDTASGTAKDFTDSVNNRVVYTVTSEDGSTVAAYHVKVTKPSFTITYTNTDDKMTSLSQKPATAGLKDAPSITLYALDGYSVPEDDDTENLTVTMGGVKLSSGQGFTYSPSYNRSSATLTITEVTGNVEVYVKALNQKNVMTSFDTNRKNGNDTGKEITPTTPNGYHMKLSYNFANDLADLPIKLEVSPEATVKVGSETLSKTMIDGKLYWTGRYDFTENAPITFTVTSEDGTPADYVVTAEIPSYAVTYTAADHITRTQVAGDDKRQWLQPLTVKFQADTNYVQQGIEVTVQGTVLEDTAYTFDYNEDSRIGILTLKSEQVTGDISITPKAYSKLTKLTDFTIDGQVGQTETDGNKIYIQMPFGSSLSAVTPKTLTLSDGATLSPDIKTAVNYETAVDHTVSYTVTAEDGVTQETYQVKVTIPTFTITYENENMEKPTLPETGLMDDPEISLKAQNGFSVPTATDTENLTVTMGGVSLTSNSSSTNGYYTYVPSADRMTATLTIHGVTGNVEFHVKALNQATELVSVGTNRANETDRARKSELTDDGFHLTLPTDFNNNLSNLPIKLEVSPGADVKTAGVPLSETTIDGKRYWTGNYDFTSGAKITFTVTPEDGGTPKDYTVTAEIPSYEVKYTDAENIQRTVTAGDTKRQWLQPLTAVFAAAENHEQQGVTVIVDGKTLTEKRDYTFDYNLTTRIGTLVIPSEQVTGEITITPRAYNNLAELTEFKIPDQVYDTYVDLGNEDTLMIEMPYDADLSKLKPTFKLSKGATSDPKLGAEVNLSVPYFYYRVTAEDGHTQEKYRLKVFSPIFGIQGSYENLENPNLETTAGLMEEPEIVLTAKEGYSVPKEQDTTNVSVIMENRNGLNEQLTQGTEDGQYTYTPSTDRSSATLTIHGVRGRVWINVKALSNAKAITEFTVANQVGDTRLNETDGTIAVDMPYATDLKVLAPVITVSDKATVASPSEAERDFSDSAANPVIYTVTAEDSTTRDYAATITIPEYQVEYELTHIDLAGLPETIALKQELQVELKAEDGYSVPEEIEIQTLEGETPVTLTAGIDYSYTPDEKKDQGVIVFAKDLSAIGDLTVTADGESRMKQIKEFTMEGQKGSSVINETDKTIIAVVAYGTDLTKIAPEIVPTDSNATVEPGSGVPRDFTESRETPLIYTVTAEDRSTQEYKVTITYPVAVVTFDSLGGTAVANQKLTAGELAVEPEAPSKEASGTEYYGFDGWYVDAAGTTAYDFSKEVPGDITIYAKWKTGYKVLTVAENGTVVTITNNDTRIFYPGETVTLKATADGGYRFGRWEESSDMALIAKPAQMETTFIMPARQVSFTAVFYRQTSGGGSGGGGGIGGTTSGAAENRSITVPTTDGGTLTTTTIVNGTSTVIAEVKKDAAGNIISKGAVVNAPATTTTTGMLAEVNVNVQTGALSRAAGAVQANEQSPLMVTVAVPTAQMNGILQNTSFDTVYLNVVISSAASAASSYQITDIKLEKAVIDTAKANGKNISAAVKDENGNLRAEWTFNGQELKNSAASTGDVNLAIDLTPVKALPAAQTELKGIINQVQENGLVITFHHRGILPSQAKIKVSSIVKTAGGITTGINPGDAVQLYNYNSATKALEAVAGGRYIVDANGYVDFTITQCSSYVLLPTGAAAQPQQAKQPQQPQQVPASEAASGAHVIVSGDTLMKIGRKYGVSTDQLISWNPGVNVNDLKIGSSLRVK